MKTIYYFSSMQTVKPHERKPEKLLDDMFKTVTFSDTLSKRTPIITLI